jgi:hypothetical protein
LLGLFGGAPLFGLAESAFGLTLESPEHQHQFVGRHHQLERLPAVIGRPAEVAEQQKISDLFVREAHSDGVFAALVCPIDVADAAEVQDRLVIDRHPLIGGDGESGGARHSAPSS